MLSAKCKLLEVVIFYFTLTTLLRTGSCNKPTRLCGEYAMETMKWLCSDPTFKFPFQFSRVNVILTFRAPKEKFYPFRYQAIMCCKKKCSENDLEKMCKYHRRLPACNKYDSKTFGGILRRARCLMQRDTHGQYGSNSVIPNRQTQIDK